MEENDSLALFDKAVIQGKATWWRMELPSGKVIFGDAKTDMLGYDAKDFKHYTDFTNLLHKDDHKKTMDAMREHIIGKSDFYETTYRIKCKDGHYIKFHDCGQIIKSDGEKRVVMGFVWKVEEGKNLDEQVKDIRKVVLENNPSMIDLIKKIKKE